MKFISLFAGIGGFDLALERLGHTSVFANDIDKYCKIIYDKHFETKQTTQDIRTVDAYQLPDFDLLCGGFPCQAFSVAGKRRGFEDTRGTLFFEVARIAKVKRPKILFLENVKGLLSHDGGRTFATILLAIDELGYDVEWQVLNSKNFGVPQNRERVFIIGHLRGTPRPEIFPIRESTEILEPPEQTGETIACLRAKQGGPDDTQTYIVVPTIRATSYKRGDNETIIGEDYGLRRLTPLECERLQGFPDRWTEGVSDTQRYKMIGNAVTTSVIYEVAKRIA